MANLKVTIVVRVAQNGKRSWVPASGKGDPSGSYYLRYCQGKIPKYVKVKTGNTYDQAEIACMKLERKLKAQSLGFILPETTSDVTCHRITDVIAVFLAKLAAPGSDGDPTPVCAYKNWFRGRRYPGIYADMFYDRVTKVQQRWPEENFDMFWDAYRTLPAFVQSNSGVCKEKQTEFRDTGRVIVMGNVWQDFNVA